MAQEIPAHIKEEFPDRLYKYRGFITTTCKSYGIHRNTYYYWRKIDEEFAEACDETFELIGDWVEGKLYENISNNDTTAIKFCLSTKFKDRGYSEKENTTVNVNSGYNEEDLSILETYIQREVAKRLEEKMNKNNE